MIWMTLVIRFVLWLDLSWRLGVASNVQTAQSLRSQIFGIQADRDVPPIVPRMRAQGLHP